MSPGALVRRCRLQSGLTQEQLAVRAGTTKTAISRLECGRVSPAFETLERVLLSLGHRAELSAVPLTPRAELAQLDAVADLTPTDRLDHAVASQASLAALLGAARER